MCNSTYALGPHTPNELPRPRQGSAMWEVWTCLTERLYYIWHDISLVDVARWRLWWMLGQELTEARRSHPPAILSGYRLPGAVAAAGAQLYIPECVRLWMLRLDFCVKRFRQMSHWYGRSPVCVRVWISRYCLQVKAAGHDRHWNGLPWTGAQHRVHYSDGERRGR